MLQGNCYIKPRTICIVLLFTYIALEEVSLSV